MKKNPVLLLIFLLVGLVLGGILGEVFQGVVPFMSYGKAIGVQPFTVDLAIIVITLGFTMSLNIAGIIGLMLALFLYSKLKF